MTAKRWLGTLARHYPSLLVSGVCHKALGEIEELEAKLAIAVEALEKAQFWSEYDDIRDGIDAGLAKIKETK